MVRTQPKQQSDQTFQLFYRYSRETFSIFVDVEDQIAKSDMSRRVARIWKRGGYFERVRSVQTTLTRIFIGLESVSDGLSEI